MELVQGVVKEVELMKGVVKKLVKEVEGDKMCFAMAVARNLGQQESL